jgi:hypothetical protein
MSERKHALPLFYEDTGSMIAGVFVFRVVAAVVGAKFELES